MVSVVNVLTEGRFGGPQNHALQVAGWMKPHGVETTVYFPNQGSDVFAERLQEADIPGVPMPLHRLTKNRRELAKWLLSFCPETVGLVRALRRRPTDIVHCNGVWQPKSVVAAKLAGKHVLLHLCDTSSPVMDALFKVTAPFADSFIFAAQRSQEIYLRDGRELGVPVTVIPSPVDTQRFAPERVEPAQAIANCHGLKVVSIGNINPSKGFDCFVRMAQRVLVSRTDVTFHIVGARLDSQRQHTAEVEKLARELPPGSLYFHGFTRDTAEMLKAADVYVCASRTEASPMAVWEAMSMAKPIVSTDVGDVSKYIRDGANGFVVSVDNAEALAHRVTRLLSNPELRHRMGAGARQTAQAELDLAHCARLQLEFYQSIVSEGGARAGNRGLLETIRS